LWGNRKISLKKATDSFNKLDSEIEAYKARQRKRGQSKGTRPYGQGETKLSLHCGMFGE